MRVAVADVGTTSSHLLIAESRPGPSPDTPSSYHVLDALKERTQLGSYLDSAGNISPEGEERLAVALSRFQQLAHTAGVQEVRVYATSALREAPNGLAVASRMRERTGIYPVVISGQREGELTYLGVSSAVELAEDNVLLDLGGGSLELVRGNAHHAQDVISLPLGSIRMTRAFMGSPGRRAVSAIEELVRESVAPYHARFGATPHTRVILSSGTAEAAASALSGLSNVNGTQFSVAELGKLLEQLRRMKPNQRSRMPGLERRGETIVAGLAVLCAALGELGATQVIVSQGALREGMLIEELTRYQRYTLGLSTRQRSVLTTAERFRANLAHAQQVAALAREIFDQLLQAGETFPPEARSLLTAAAALHEIGLIVSPSSHHKHSAYLIRHADLRGFSPREIELIAQVARYHRKSLPKPSHLEYQALCTTDQKLVARLAAILRVADGLDRAYAGNTSVVGLQRGAGWTLTVTGASPLDLLGVQGKADLWEREFGPLHLTQTSTEAL